MRSLFFRIFLALVVMGAVVIFAGTAVYSLAPPRPDVRPLLAELVRPRATAALEALARGDREAARQSLDELRAIGGTEVTLVDGSGVLLGEGDAEVLEIAAEARATRGVRSTTLAEVELIAVPIGGVERRSTDVIAVGVTPHLTLRRNRALGVRMVTMLLLSGLAAFLLARYVARPLEALRGAAKALAEGDTSVRVASAVAGRTDELSALAHDFDRMAERIAELLEAQSRLLLDVSHELRSPLARLMLAIELARSKLGPDAAPALDRMERETQRLADLVSEVLTIARLEHRASAPQARVPLRALVADRVESADFAAKADGKSVILEAPEGEIAVQGDEELLRRAIDNVLGNAVRFTGKGTAVQVQLAIHDERAVITVRDHGPGVPEAELPAIFRPFHRVGTARERANGGTGLGLAITDRAIRAHQGTVVAENVVAENVVAENVVAEKGSPENGSPENEPHAAGLRVTISLAIAPPENAASSAPAIASA